MQFNVIELCGFSLYQRIHRLKQGIWHFMRAGNKDDLRWVKYFGEYLVLIVLKLNKVVHD